MFSFSSFNAQIIYSWRISIIEIYQKSYLGKKNILNFQKDLFINTHVPFPPLKFEIMEKKCMNQASSSPPNVLVHNEVIQEVTFCRFMMLQAVLFPCSCSKTLTSRHEATRKCGHRSSTVMTLSPCFPCRRSQWMLSCEFTVDSECAVAAY